MQKSQKILISLKEILYLKKQQNILTMKLPCICPSCQKKLQVKSLQCENCATEVNGLYSLPLLTQLTEDEQNFILNFIKSSGSLKDMDRLLNISYPSVRNRLDDIILKLKEDE